MREADTATPITVAILGAGTNGADLLATLLTISGGKVLAVADPDPVAPGMVMARASGVPTTTDRVQAIRDADVILDTSGDTEPILPSHPAWVRGAATRLLLLTLHHDRKTQVQLHLHERMALMKSLLAAAAHELNNPLCIITGYSALVGAHVRTGEWGELRGDAQNIAEAADRLHRLTERFLKFARPAFKVGASSDVNECIVAVIGMLEHDLRRSEIRVELDLGSSLPPASGDGRALQEVVSNLVTNARDMITERRQGSVITVRTSLALDNAASRQPECVEIQVIDDGPGIEPMHLPHIFEPLFTTRRPGPNMGLGLSICYGIVTALGGTIFCESEPGRGAVFVVRLMPAGATSNKPDL